MGGGPHISRSAGDAQIRRGPHHPSGSGVKEVWLIGCGPHSLGGSIKMLRGPCPLPPSSGPTPVPFFLTRFGPGDRHGKWGPLSWTTWCRLGDLPTLWGPHHASSCGEGQGASYSTGGQFHPPMDKRHVDRNAASRDFFLPLAG